MYISHKNVPPHAWHTERKHISLHITVGSIVTLTLDNLFRLLMKEGADKQEGEICESNPFPCRVPIVRQ